MRFRRPEPPRELEPREAYRLWAASYPASAHTPLMEVEERAVLRLLPDLRGRRTLDLACGSGRYAAAVAERGAIPVVGCDVSPEMLGRARMGPAALVQADLRALPFVAGSFEVVVCGLALGHVVELDAAIGEMARVLGGGGTVVYSEMHPLGTLAGWKRTFRGPDGRAYAVRHVAHLRTDHEKACDEAGLQVEAVVEPLVEVACEWTGRPAALVVKARKR